MPTPPSRSVLVPAAPPTDGPVDAPTAVWFGAFCTGLTAVAGLSGGSASAGPDAAGLSATGDRVRTAAATLAGLPAPNIPGGQRFAATVVPALTAFGDELRGIGRRSAGGDRTAGADLGQALSTVTGALDDYETLQIGPATQVSIQRIPACARLGR